MTTEILRRMGLSALAALLVTPVFDAGAQQPIQLVNDNGASVSDSDVWILFAGNPADVTVASGASVSGVRNLAIPIGSVTTAAPANSTTVTSTLYQNPTFSMPSPPFPLTFISGENKGTVAKVTAYNTTTGTFTVATTALAAQAAGDQISIGAYSQQLSSFPKVGTVKSKLSGQTQPVYQVNADMASGVIYVSYGQITYGNSAPVISDSKIAFQTVELTTPVGAGATTSDLTVIDYFSIPIQIESINQSTGATDDIRTFYFKLSTIETGIEAFGAKQINNALYLGPGQVAANSSTGNPRPFPSFEDYLDSLKSKTFEISGTQAFGVPNPTMVYGIAVGGNYTADYGYDVDVKEDKEGNFSVVLDPIAGENQFTAGTKPSYFPNPSNVKSIVINLPKGAKGVASFNEVIYGAILDSQSFEINLTPGSPSLTPTPPPGPYGVSSATANNTTTSFACTTLAALNFLAPFSVTFGAGTANPNATVQIASIDSAGNLTTKTALTAAPNLSDTFTVTVAASDVFTQLYTNSVYSWVVADFLSAVNFGFPGGPNTGDNSAEWFSQFPQNFPFGLARGTPDDGFYNPWAAYFYNSSDAYGFAFSDRVAPSPLMSTNPDTEFFRITVLPETQLDAPFVTLVEADKTSITMSWPTETGATYTIKMQPNVAGATHTITSTTGTTTATVDGLSPGSPYTFTVTATAGGRESLSLPFYTSTIGSVKPIEGDLPVQFSFQWAGTAQQPFPAAANNTIYINGSAVPLNSSFSTGSTNFQTTGNAGQNIYVLEFRDESTGKPIFETSYVVNFSGTSASYNIEGTPKLFGTEPGSVTASKGPFSPGVQPVINTSFYPSTRKEFADVTTPVTSNPKPDLAVGHDAKTFRGRGIYNRTGEDQIIETKIARGEQENYYVRLKNSGKRRSAFRLFAQEAGERAFEVRYFDGGRDVTEEILSKDGYAVSGLASKDWITIRVQVEASEDARTDAKLSSLIQVKHIRSRRVSDAAGLKVEAR